MTFFEKILNSESKTITSAAIIIGASSFISRILGLLRDRILAGTFGAGNELDIYWAAFRIPDLVYNLMVIGALSAGFIPVFTSYLAKNDESGKREMWYLANGVLNLLIVALIVICGILAIFTPWLMKFITPGFSGEKMAMTINLTRLMFLSPIFLGASAVFGGILQSYKRFFVFSLSPIIYNLGIIFGAMFLVKHSGLYGLAWGVILGAAGHMLIQIPSAVACGYSWRMVFDLTHEGIKKISRLMVPRTLSLATGQISRLGMTAIASTLGAGSLAIFNLADNLRSFPLGVAGLSFAVAAFPTLAEAAARKDWREFVKNFSGTTRQILFFMIPASVWLVVLRAQLVRIVLGTGKFDWQDTILTIETLQYFCIGLAASALVYFLIRAFFALEDTKTPFFIGLVTALCEIGFAYFLSKTLS
ncbi:MAG: murein biosynthesis integral membrane protein MurJ, partial [Candidatus Portnoybacteria bacterium]|nr:murein biosynthesis integral membrane protein MurJ [Candidatus Portnoybacteria bacterium]